MWPKAYVATAAVQKRDFAIYFLVVLTIPRPLRSAKEPQLNHLLNIPPRTVVLKNITTF